ncbi:recombinase family protein [Cellulosilyticum sp. I15G10I2]|uniref:recombinase family protein n=1 Tax=Cellulosilyticum sp. I15G10I2 TaxID=1892843 RepID=UPI00085BB025|nr:recombinase family protein [Cellulosilyticum sp. I15G10I2]
MKVAIYARKSKMSEKGESIDNQINTCKEYISRWSTYSNNEGEFVVYKDEGFSGGNTDRPEFQRMLNDAKNNRFNMLICYRLDRVSRNIADFANTYQMLQENSIEFISVKEQFDTSTPIGRAMLNIAMVFAQLERETIAERVRDNMLSLARTGRWLGGTTPTGFNSEPIEYLDQSMNTKKMYKLTEDQEELEKVKLIFSKFLEIKSLRGTESYLLIQDIVTKRSCKYTAATIKDILINPVYVAADSHIYDYLSSIGCQICNQEKEFNGKCGLMVYNKTSQSGKSASSKDYSDWIVSIGKHKPIVSGNEWILVQELLASNTSKSFYTKDTMQYGLLTNLIKCTHCGSNMKIKKGKINADGSLAYTYVCTTKEMSRRTKCSVKNIIGQEADKDVLDYLLKLAEDDSFMQSTLSLNKVTITRSIEQTSKKLTELKESLIENESSINNLMNQLAKLPPESGLIDRYMKQLNDLDTLNKSIKDNIEKLQSEETAHHTINLNLDLVKKALSDLIGLKDSDDIHVQRSLVRTVIESVTWDGENLHIDLFGQKKLDAEQWNSTHLCRDSKCNPYC